MSSSELISPTANVSFSHVSLQPGEKRSAQLAYFNHEEDIGNAMQTIFHEKNFDLPLPKIFITLEGGLNNNSERSNDFSEKQFSTSVAKFLLDIGRNKLKVQNDAPWLFTYVRHDFVAGRIIQTTKQQYLANDIPLTRFVNIGIDVCQSMPLENAPYDYQSIVSAITGTKNVFLRTDSVGDECTNSYRILNKRLSRLILYGRQKQDLVDRCTILQRCVDEMSRLQECSTSESLVVPKIILLYGGDVVNVSSIYRLMNVELEQRKFGLVIIRGSGGLADVLAWVSDKIRGGGSVCFHNSDRMSLTRTFLRELTVIVDQLLSSDMNDDLIALITYLSLSRCAKVRVCDEDDDLSLYFLEALVSTNSNQRLSSVKLHLSLAFDLNQPKFASKMLRANQDIPEQDLIQLAQMAIIRDQVEFLPVLEDVCGITSDHLGEHFEKELSLKMNYNHALFLECIQENFGCDLEEIYRPTDETSEHAEDEIQSINVKLFLWAVFFDHYNLSLHFWRRLNDRLCGALVAANVYRHTADLCVKRSSTESITVEKLRQHANEYENLAIRLLNSLYTSNSNMARLAIKRENFEFNKLSSLEVAILSHSENFVAHTSVQEVFDIVWCGDVSSKIKGKSFNRMLSVPSSFDDATNKIPVQENKNLLKYFLTIKKKLYRPQIKYQVHFLFYITFLCLLSYLVLFVKIPILRINEDIKYSVQNGTCSQNEIFCSSSTTLKQRWSWLQMVIHIWIFMFALEEFRQFKLLKTRDIGIGQTFIIYLRESWNKLDVLCVCLYLISIILECFNTKITLNAARAFLAIDVVFWFIRLLILLMIDRTVGPMLLMIQAMVGALSDMGTFFSIFFVFTSAYGVASFALLKNGELFLDLSVFRKIFHQAYWHVFGQMNDLDDIENNFEITGWAAFALLACYMAVSNILLVNLLVAMFSNTFDRMFAKMDTLWKFYRYHIIKEYTILPPLPPPFNLFYATDQSSKPFDPELSSDQILDLQRREALAYASDKFENATKDCQSDTEHREELNLHVRQLRKMITHIKITCEASIGDILK
ncbi:unnamed protein product [Adineta steineri]|uniref:Uncharacterized protein n=1 Tax=Adineta steineri TaxID=433720 RepID=A0A813U5X1_9BILA|nr:unnamed protein product [Adineta steineri]